MSFAVVDGVHYTVLQDMRSAIHDLYKSLFIELETWRSKVDLMRIFCYFFLWENP